MQINEKYTDKRRPDHISGICASKRIFDGILKEGDNMTEGITPTREKCQHLTECLPRRLYHGNATAALVMTTTTSTTGQDFRILSPMPVGTSDLLR